MSPTRGLLRCLRASSLGVVGFVLALGAHVAAGGVAPAPEVLLLLAGLIALAATLLTGVRLSPLRLGASLAAMQVVLHETFMWLGAPGGCLMTGMSPTAGGPMGNGNGTVPDCATGMAQAGMGHGSVFAATTMIGAHLVATAVLAALLAYGEKVLWFLAGCVRTPRWLRVGLAELPVVRDAASHAQRTPRLIFPCGGVGRRGPPQGMLAIVCLVIDGI